MKRLLIGLFIAASLISSEASYFWDSGKKLDGYILYRYKDLELNCLMVHSSSVGLTISCVATK